MTETRLFRRVGGFSGGEVSHIEIAVDDSRYRSVRHDGEYGEWAEHQEGREPLLTIATAEDRVRRGLWEEIQ